MTRAEQMRQYKADGHTSKEVAQKYGVSECYARQICKGIAPQGQGPINEDVVSLRIKEKSNGLLEYLSGYTNKEKPVRLRCSICGGEFERSYHSITANGGATCPHCVERERLQLKEARDAEKERKRKEREAKAIERKAEEERKRAEREHSCPVCGAITYRPRFCSNECYRKTVNQRGELRRRNLIKSVLIDKDISVEGLYRRDKGRCALCGKPCNFEDYVIRDGIKICGDWYPSVDHIIPLARGGVHSWDNVQLAHRRCNWEKSDDL